MGDYNCVTHMSDLEAPIPQQYSREKCVKLNEVMETFGYEDMHKVLYGHLQEFTWVRPGRSGARLDRVLVAEEKVEEVESLNYRLHLSDHKAVVVEEKGETFVRENR